VIVINRGPQEGRPMAVALFLNALRTVKDYMDTVEYVHLSPVRRGLGEASGRMGMV